MKKGKILVVLMGLAMVAGMFAGCGTKEKEADFDKAKDVTVCSREEGSGTRGAFVELFGIEKKDENGKKVDHTTQDANISNSTSVVLTTVAGNDYAIGYISLGSLNDTVKAVKINGAEPTAENVKSGKYEIARPFNIVTKGEATGAAKDFINYIMSKDGQKVVEEAGYIPLDAKEDYKGEKVEGKVTVAGSSSVTPVMQKLVEAYGKVNDKAKIEVQESDSTTGVTNAMDGICDIGMASRELKDNEKGLEVTKIAMDGIAVIVNKNNPVEDLTKETVEQIYTGQLKMWSDIIK